MNYNSADINRLIDALKEYFKKYITKDTVHISDILTQSDIKRLDRSKIIEAFKNNFKFHFDEHKNSFSRKKKYDIQNAHDFLFLLKSNRNGIEEDEDLYECYFKLKDDIELLKSENRIRVVDCLNPTKRTFLFAKHDLFDSDPQILKAPNLMKEHWKIYTEKISSSVFKNKKIEEIEKMTLNDKRNQKRSRKGKRDSRINKIHNFWMTDKIDFKGNMIKQTIQNGN